jgi:hypothetical protein
MNRFLNKTNNSNKMASKIKSIDELVIKQNINHIRTHFHEEDCVRVVYYSKDENKLKHLNGNIIDISKDFPYFIVEKINNDKIQELTKITTEKYNEFSNVLYKCEMIQHNHIGYSRKNEEFISDIEKIQEQLKLKKVY